jgi:hypothetical protein
MTVDLPTRPLMVLTTYAGQVCRSKKLRSDQAIPAPRIAQKPAQQRRPAMESDTGVPQQTDRKHISIRQKCVRTCH